MKVFYLLCVLPLILASPRDRDSSDDSHEVGDWENDGPGALLGRGGGQRNGVMRLVARISKNRPERHENSHEEDRHSRHHERQSEKWGDSGERNDEDMRGRHGYKQPSADRMMRHHDRKQGYNHGDSSDEDDSRRERRGRMGHRHDGDSGENDRHGERGHQGRRGDRPEWRNGMERPTNGRRHGPGDYQGGHSHEENDRYDREHRREKGGEDYRAQWMSKDNHGSRDRDHGHRDRDSSEEELRREYVRFFGRLTFNKAQDENMREEKHRHRDHTRESGRDTHADHRMSRREGEGHERMDKRDEESAMEIEKRLKMVMGELYKKDQYELAKVLTLSFLKMCECDSDDATDLLKSFIARAERPENGTRALEVPNVPDFKGNTTARVEFYRSLTEEQMSLLFGHDLVKSMCSGAKMFLVEAKSFFDKYFPSYEGSISLHDKATKGQTKQG